MLKSVLRKGYAVWKQISFCHQTKVKLLAVIGRLVLINLVLITWYCIWYNSSSCQKEFWIDWMTFDQESFGKKTVKNETLFGLMGCGLSFKGAGGLCIHDLAAKNLSFLVIDLLSFLPGMEFGKLLWEETVKALFQVFWKSKDSHFYSSLMVTNKHFFHFGSFSIKDGSKSDSERTNG